MRVVIKGRVARRTRIGFDNGCVCLAAFGVLYL